MSKKNPTTVDVLRRMKSLLRKGWTKGYFARTKSGRITEATSRHAVSFCLIGARQKACADLHALGIIPSVDGLINKCVPGGISVDVVDYNDAKGRTKKEILAVVDCAIAQATATASARS